MARLKCAPPCGDYGQRWYLPRRARTYGQMGGQEQRHSRMLYGLAFVPGTSLGRTTFLPSSFALEQYFPFCRCPPVVQPCSIPVLRSRVALGLAQAGLLRLEVRVQPLEVQVDRWRCRRNRWRCRRNRWLCGRRASGKLYLGLLRGASHCWSAARC